MKIILPDKYFLSKISRPRVWVNSELKRLAPDQRGDVVNVSGENDADRLGSDYMGYFCNARSYSITNQGELDLEQPLPDHLRMSCDCAFCLSVLEHIYDVRAAVRNLCEMTRDTVIVTVPFIFGVHWDENLGDYWRFTPFALARLFEDEGFGAVYASAGPLHYRDWMMYLWVARRGKTASVRPEDLPTGYHFKMTSLGESIYSFLGEIYFILTRIKTRTRKLVSR